VHDLIAVLAGCRAADPATAHRAAACSYVEDHLTEPRLRAGQVAAAIGISERQLSRVFAVDSTSIPRYILSRRLHLAHCVLSITAATERTQTMADVAARCGSPRRRTSPTSSASTSTTTPAISASRAGLARDDLAASCRDP
jgi:AraC-like DNA-binding protein